MYQNVIVCEVCKTEPLQHFCNQCEVRLCKNCVIIHLDSESVEGHTIVRYRYKDARNVTPRQCSTHQEKKKTLFCKNCEVQICTKGLAKHLEHEFTDLKDLVHSKYLDITKDIDFLKTKVQPDFESCIAKLNQFYEETNIRYDKERQRMIDAEKDFQDKITGAMKALLDEMETRRYETLTKLADLKKNSETKMQTIDQFINKCEAAKTDLEDILTLKFDEALLDMEHSVMIALPQYISPRKWTVDVGKFKSITESRRIFDIDVESNIHLPVSGREFQEKDNTSTSKTDTPNLPKTKDYTDKVIREFEKNSQFPKAEKEYQDLLIGKRHTSRPITPFKNLPKTKDYIDKVIREFEKDSQFPEAEKEYRDLLIGKRHTSSRPVTPFKEENVTAEQREYKPNLAGILLLANSQHIANAGLAWIAYVDLIDGHKQAVSLQSTSKTDNPNLPKTKDYTDKVIREFEKNSQFPKAEKEYQDLLIGKRHTSRPITPFKNLPKTKDYIDKVIREFEKDSQFPEAEKEYRDLLIGKRHTSSRPVTPFKEKNVTAEQREYKPNLAGILLLANSQHIANAGLAWFAYVDLIDGHKQAVSLQEEVPSLFELLERETNKESDEYEEAYQDLVHMFTCQAVLRCSFPQAHILPLVTVNICKPEEVPEEARERELYRYLTNLKSELYDNHYSAIWREYGTLMVAENLLDLARKANGPDRNIYVVVEKKTFYTMQSELQKKTQEVEELSTRLSRQRRK